MNKFFLNLNKGLEIRIFSVAHLFLILLEFLAIFIVYRKRDYFCNIKKQTKRKYQIFLASIIILNWFLRRGSFIYYGVYDYHNHLDLNFCNITSILFLIYSLTNNKNIYNICYYMAFIGPLLAILIPSVNIRITNYSFYSYLVIHHIIFLFNYMFMYMENLKFEKRYLKQLGVFLIIYFMGVYLFNYVFHTGYNMPITFLNGNITNLLIIKIVTYNIYTQLLTMYGLIILFILLGIINLKLSSKI